MAKMTTRRDFVRVGSLAAAALVPAGGLAEVPEGGARARFEVFPRQTVEAMVTGLQAVPGARDIVSAKGIGVTVTVSAEAGKIAKEFEMHEHRDHVFQVLEGTTVYEIGGMLKGGRQTKAGEWLAAECDGFSKVTLEKGDLLSIPRGTPHRRVTEGAVSLLLINTNPGV